eukprot:scaffold5613_cov133-Isochrysis_galbana.AAC.12
MAFSMSRSRADPQVLDASSAPNLRASTQAASCIAAGRSARSSSSAGDPSPAPATSDALALIATSSASYAFHQSRSGVAPSSTEGGSSPGGRNLSRAACTFRRSSRESAAFVPNSSEECQRAMRRAWAGHFVYARSSVSWPSRRL